MKFGLRYCNTGTYVDPNKALELAQAGEEAFGIVRMGTAQVAIGFLVVDPAHRVTA